MKTSSLVFLPIFLPIFLPVALADSIVGTWVVPSEYSDEPSYITFQPDGSCGIKHPKSSSNDCKYQLNGKQLFVYVNNGGKVSVGEITVEILGDFMKMISKNVQGDDETQLLHRQKN